MSIITIKATDITKVKADAIVNAANTHLREGGGVCGSIFKAAGVADLTAACEAIGHCNVGDVAVTQAFALDADIIIHAVGPKWNGGEDYEEYDLYICYYNALEAAIKHNCKSIALPLISSGKFGMPYEKVWDQALSACADFIDDKALYDFNIVFAVKEKYAGYGENRIRDSKNIQRILEKYKKKEKSFDENRDFKYGFPYIFNRYLELIFYNDQLWKKMQFYAGFVFSREERTPGFFAWHRSRECIDTWRGMLENMGGGIPPEFFAAVSFEVLSYRDAGHDIDEEEENAKCFFGKNQANTGTSDSL